MQRSPAPKSTDNQKFQTALFYIALFSVSWTTGPFRIPSLGITVSDAFLIAAAVFLPFSSRKANSTPIAVKLMYGGATLYTIGLMVTSTTTYHAWDVLFTAVKFFVATALAVAIATQLLNDEKKISTALNFAIAGCALNGLFALFQMKTGSSIFFATPNFWGRFSGLSEHPNELGPLCAVLSAPTIYLATYKTTKLQPFYLLSLAGLIAGIYASASMSAAGGVVIAVMGAIFAARKPFRAIVGTLSAVIATPTIMALITVAGAGGANSLGARLSQLFSSQSDYATAASRLAVYETAWNSILSNPFVGHLEEGLTPHNFVIFSWWHGGILSLFGCLIFVASILIAISLLYLRTSTEHSQLPAALAVASFVMLLEISLSPPAVRRSTWMICWIIAALLCTTHAQYSKSTPKKRAANSNSRIKATAPDAQRA